MDLLSEKIKFVLCIKSSPIAKTAPLSLPLSPAITLGHLLVNEPQTPALQTFVHAGPST